MVEKRPSRTMDFNEEDEGFVKQLSGDIGCYYRKAGERTYSLNNCDSEVQGEMGVFAWVHKESDNYFWVTTRKVWVEEAKTIELAGKRVSGAACLPKDAQNGDSVFLDAKAGYQKTVRALKLINKVRQVPATA